MAGQCPYSLLLERLTAGDTYYIRVAALGDVDAQAVNPTGDPPDNTNWSGVIEVVPVNQPPSSPGPVSLYVLDGSTLQLHMELPTESGGVDIDEYLIEVDSVSTFSSTGLVPFTVLATHVRYELENTDYAPHSAEREMGLETNSIRSGSLRASLHHHHTHPILLASPLNLLRLVAHTLPRHTFFSAWNPLQWRQRGLQHP